MGSRGFETARGDSDSLIESQGKATLGRIRWFPTYVHTEEGHGQFVTCRPKRRDEPHVPLGAHFTRLPLSAPRSRHHLHDTIIEYSRIRPTPVPNPIVVTRRIPSSVSLESGGVSGKRNVCRDGTRGDISTNHEGACGWGQNMRVWYR